MRGGGHKDKKCPNTFKNKLCRDQVADADLI